MDYLFYISKKTKRFFWTFYSSNNPGQMYHGFHKNILEIEAQLFSKLIINVSWAENHFIRMISEGSCDTEDWSNDAENSALNHRNKLHSFRKRLF